MNDATLHTPPHPGEALREAILPEMKLTVTTAAQQLGMARSSLSRILHGRASITPVIALRIEAWLGVENGGRAELWLAQQAAYDLWQLRHPQGDKP